MDPGLRQDDGVKAAHSRTAVSCMIAPALAERP
jgi:hypothetical protein